MSDARRGAEAPWPEDPAPPSAGLPLAGTRVLDLSRVLAGPFCTMVLGDLGADVIKVEQPGTGDMTRTWGPPFHGPDAAYYLAMNRNRRSVEADLGSEDGRRLVERLAEAADVVVENFLPRQFEALGLDRLRQRAEHLVWVSVRGAGGDGPLAGEPTFDLLAQGRAGIMGVTGSAESGPTKVGAPVADVITGLYAAVAAAAGLAGRRRRPGAPAVHVEVPLFECTLTALVNQAANHLVAGLQPGLLGNDHPTLVPYGPLPTADGTVLVAATTDAQFVALCRASGLGPLADDPDYVSNPQRVAHRAALMGRLGARFVELPTAQWLAVLGAAGVPSAPVNTVAEALKEEQLVADQMVMDVEHPAGSFRLLGSPYRVDGVRPPVRRPPPGLGQDTEAVRAALGLPGAASGRPAVAGG